MDNECNDLDEVAEEIYEIIRSVWTQREREREKEREGEMR